jgi:hypothetical protein
MLMILDLASLVLIGYLLLHLNFLLVSPNFQLHSPYIPLSVFNQTHLCSINIDLKKYSNAFSRGLKFVFKFQRKYLLMSHVKTALKNFC